MSKRKANISDPHKASSKQRTLDLYFKCYPQDGSSSTRLQKTNKDSRELEKDDERNVESDDERDDEGNVESDDERDDEGNVESDVSEDGESSNLPKDKLPQMSIYKLHAERLPDFPKRNITDISTKIIMDSLKKEFGEFTLLTEDTSPFTAVLFEDGKKLSKNPIVEVFKKISEKAKTEIENKGTQTSGTLIVFFRVNNEKAEIFCLCRGDYYRKVLKFADFSFRTTIAQAFMDGSSLRSESYVTIAGPEITVDKTIREKETTDFHIGLLERVYTRLEGPIFRESKLRGVVLDDAISDTEINLEVGQNYVKIKKKLDLTRICRVLQTFSNQFNNPKQTDNLRKLDQARRIEDCNKTEELNKTLTEKFSSILDDETVSRDLSLSHNLTVDWAVSSYVTLYAENGILETWYTTPTLDDVKRALVEIDDVNEKITEGRVHIAFMTKQGKEESKPIQNFLHGTVTDNDGITFYKLTGKWFQFTTDFAEAIDRQFVGIIRNTPNDTLELNKYLLPWKKKNLSIDLSDVQQWFKLSPDDAKALMNILQTPITFIDDAGVSALDRRNCIFIESSEIIKELNKKELLNFEENTGQTKITSYMQGTDGRNMPTASTSHAPVTSKGEKQTKTKKGTKDDKKKKSRKQMLEKYMWRSNKEEKKFVDLMSKSCNKIEEICKVFSRKIQLCKKDHKSDVWKVLNPNVPGAVFDKIAETMKNQIPQAKLVLFLRSFMLLKEEEYNENYQFWNIPGVNIVTGDRVLCKNVELFDLMFHRAKDKTTFLVHVKEGFGQTTRDACSQIRISSQLLWKDRLDSRQQNTFINAFWTNATEYAGDDVYRIKLKNKLVKVGKEEFLGMFTNTKIIFVYAFLDKREDLLENLSKSFNMITEKLFQNIKPSGKDKVIMDLLQRKGFINDRGYISDKFSDNVERFMKAISKECERKSITEKTQKEIHKILLENGRCKSRSVIAKLELLNLQERFRQYWMDNEQQFELRVCQIPSQIQT